ncbi:MAG: hypothetical protein IT169_07540 [Bryobacterales bacterium]|nr:hypothetical protein [Bryobacterales bacterium]
MAPHSVSSTDASVGSRVDGRPLSRYFSVHGFEFLLTGTSEQAISGIASDFAYFQAPDSGRENGCMVLELNEGSPVYDGLPVCDASAYTPRNVVYRSGGRRLLDYGGRGLGILDEAAQHFSMKSEDSDLVYEAAYLFLLSRIGEHLDARRLHRLHALAMSYRGRSILVLLPMGGGKSTLGAELLKNPDIRILSDDSPIIARDARALAYPLRLGLLKGREGEIPPEFIRMIDRMEFGPKFLVDYSYFAARVTADAEPGLLLIGKRTLSATPRFAAAPYTSAVRAMIPNLVVGLGLFQGLEFVLGRGYREIWSKVGVGLSRLRNAHTLARRSRCFDFHMGRDLGANAAAVIALAEKTFAAQP